MFKRAVQRVSMHPDQRFGLPYHVITLPPTEKLLRADFM